MLLFRMIVAFDLFCEIDKEKNFGTKEIPFLASSRNEVQKKDTDGFIIALLFSLVPVCTTLSHFIISAMAATDEQSQNQNLPQVLLLKPPPAFALFGDEFFSSNKFQFLKAYESSVPIDQFLEANAESIEAILSSGGAAVTADILQQLPLVRLVVTTHAGLDHIDLAECRRRNIAVTNVGNIFSDDVADHAIGLLIDLLRKISAADRYVRQGLWGTNGDFPIGCKVNILFLSSLKPN